MLLKLKLRIGALLLIVGAMLAVIGEVVSIANTIPLSSAWFSAIGLIVLGTIVLVYGANMYAQLSENLNLLGVLGVGIFFLGGILVIVGTIAIDGVILPLLAGVATAIGATVNTLGSGTQNATNTVSSGLSDAGNTISSAFGGSSNSATIPTANVPQVDGMHIVNSALAGMKLPTVDMISNMGHFFLSGAPLALGGLVIGLALLRAKAFPRTTALFLIASAALTLIFQWLSFLPTLAQVTGIVFFLSLAWLGVSIIFPTRTNIVLNRESGKKALLAIKKLPQLAKKTLRASRNVPQLTKQAFQTMKKLPQLTIRGFHIVTRRLTKRAVS